MVDFGGWDMPVNYGSQIEEHHAVRRDAGMFDVSHMCVVDLRGARVRDFLRRLLANDVAKLTQPGKALYSCMLHEHGGVIDDLIVYFLERRSGSAWSSTPARATRTSPGCAQHAPRLRRRPSSRADLAMIAVQGPNARAKAAERCSIRRSRRARSSSARSSARQLGDWFVARTGYTGEDGFEIMLPAARRRRVLAALCAMPA